MADGPAQPVTATPFLAILGPTASGKSALALAVAERTGGEIVACDSQQVYIGMDIGTAKPTADERRRVRHHALDLVRPDEPFHAARWAAVARATIADIAAQRRLAIVVGGTGLYYRALVGGLFEAPPPDATIRARHRATAEADGPEALHRRLVDIDPASGGGHWSARRHAGQPRPGNLRADGRDHHRAATPGGAARRFSRPPP